MTPDEWRSTVGVHVEQRRTELRLSVRGAAKRAGVSEGLWRQIESGRRVLAAGVERTVSPRADTAHAIATALDWEGDALARLAAGAKPAAVPAVSSPAGGTELPARLAVRVAALEQSVEQLRSELDGVLVVLDRVVGRQELVTATLRPDDPAAAAGQQ